MKEINMKIQCNTCCKSVDRGLAALSRKTGKRICSDCGIQEALNEFNFIWNSDKSDINDYNKFYNRHRKNK